MTGKSSILCFCCFRLTANATINWKDVISPSSMRINQKYSFYYLGIAKLLVLGVFPLSSLVYFNINIYQGIKFPPSLSGQDKKRQQSLEKDWAKVLIGIVVIFIICHTFRVIIEIDNMIVSEKTEFCYKAGKSSFTLWSIIVDPLSEVMMILNSSINMLIYTCLSANFRKHIIFCVLFVYILGIICGECKTKKSTSRRGRGTSLDNRTSLVSHSSCTNIPMINLPTNQ